MNHNPFLTIPAAQCAPQPLAPIGSWRAATHVWDAKELDALALCQASGRPLLIRGEPGTGKSQIARAAAARLGWAFRYDVITARHEAQDLLWQYDAVERLANANRGTPTRMQDFVMPAVLWSALNPAGADAQRRRALERADADGSKNSPSRNPQPDPADPARGTVVLLDEIDKADSDLPNSLLEVLANHGFTLPWGEALHPAGAEAAPTLVILTSNEERELPAAFVRRCVCLHLVPPPDHDRRGFAAWLTQRAAAHYPDMAPAVLQQAAAMVLDDRQACPAGLGARPGLAEYLDLLRALRQIAPDDAALQVQWLGRLAPYALLKQYPDPQQRGLALPDPREVAAA